MTNASNMSQTFITFRDFSASHNSHLEGKWERHRNASFQLLFLIFFLFFFFFFFSSFIFHEITRLDCWRCDSAETSTLSLLGSLIHLLVLFIGSFGPRNAVSLPPAAGRPSHRSTEPPTASPFAFLSAKFDRFWHLSAFSVDVQRPGTIQPMPIAFIIGCSTATRYSNRRVRWINQMRWGGVKTNVGKQCRFQSISISFMVKYSTAASYTNQVVNKPLKSVGIHWQWMKTM